MQQIQIRSRRIAYEFWRIPDTELERRVCGIHGGNSRTTVIPRYEGNEVPGRIIYRSVNTCKGRGELLASVGVSWPSRKISIFTAVSTRLTSALSRGVSPPPSPPPSPLKDRTSDFNEPCNRIRIGTPLSCKRSCLSSRFHLAGSSPIERTLSAYVWPAYRPFRSVIFARFKRAYLLYTEFIV